MSGTAWNQLDQELDRWAQSGAPATLWLRDDDAIDATEALDRLLDLAQTAGTPVALAVIPALARPALARRLAQAGAVSVLQHGYAHANHATAGVKKSEYSDNRPMEAMTGELVRGRSTILRMFGEAASPVLAPPWNRMTPALTPNLAACGLAGLSRFTARAARLAAKGVVEANAHVDLIAWRSGRVGKPASAIATEIETHLRDRRLGSVDAAEPTGILSHHLAMDQSAWTALAEVLARIGRDPRVAWLKTADIFHSGTAGTAA